MLKMFSKTPVSGHSGHLENKVGSHANLVVALRIQVQIGCTKRFAPVATLPGAWEQNAAPILGCRSTRPPWHIMHGCPNSTICLYIKNPFCQVIVHIYSTYPPILVWFGGLWHFQPMQYQVFTVQTSTWKVYRVFGKLPRLTTIAYCYHFELSYVYKDCQLYFQVLGYGSLSSVTTLVALEQAALGSRGMGIYKSVQLAKECKMLIRKS